MATPITVSEVDTLRHIFSILAFVSFFSSMFVVITYTAFKRKFPLNMALFFSLCACFLAFFCLFSWYFGASLMTNNTACMMQGIGMQYFASAIVFWWFASAVNLYLALVKNLDTSSFKWYIHAFCWGIPLITTIFPIPLNYFGYIGIWCWINDSKAQFIFLYAYMGLFCVIGVALWILIFIYITHVSRKTVGLRSTVKQPYSYHIVRYIIFLLCFILIFSFLFAYRVYDALHANPPYFVMMMHVICVGVQGIVAFLTFGIRKDNFLLWIGCCKTFANKMHRYENVNSV